MTYGSTAGWPKVKHPWISSRPKSVSREKLTLWHSFEEVQYVVSQVCSQIVHSYIWINTVYINKPLCWRNCIIFSTYICYPLIQPFKLNRCLLCINSMLIQYVCYVLIYLSYMMLCYAQVPVFKLWSGLPAHWHQAHFHPESTWHWPRDEQSILLCTYWGPHQSQVWSS